MKKLLTLLLSALCAWTLTALTETVNDITWNYEVSNGEVTIYNSTYSPAIPSSTSGAITIPSTLGGYPVTSIGEYAFRDCTALTSVTIHEGVTFIGVWAFKDCRSLTSVTIPEGVTTIGASAFSGCTSLTSVTIPSSVTSIGASTFWNCESLTSVTIPESVTSIGDEAFSGCDSLTSVTIPEGVTSIGNGAFYSCSSLTSVTIPEGVTSIGDYAFEDCSRLTSVTIPEGVTSIGVYAFAYCNSLTSVTIPSSVTSIGAFAFEDCRSLTSVMIPSSVTSIGVYAFEDCSSLTSVTFEGVPPMVGSSAFYGVASGCKGYYPSTKASAWAAVISNGTWNGLTMEMVSIPDIPTFAVRATVIGDGEVSGTGKYEAGAEVTLTAVPGEGMVFCGWSTTPVTTCATYTFTMPAAEVALTAYFAPAVVVERYVSGNNLMSKEAAKQELLAAKEVYTADELQQMGEVAFDTPVIVVAQDTIEIAVKFKSAESLSAQWQAMALKDAVLTVDEVTGEVRVSVKKPDNLSGSFYKFVVDNQSQTDVPDNE